MRTKFLVGTARNWIFVPFVKDGVVHPAVTNVKLRVQAIKTKQKVGAVIRENSVEAESVHVIALSYRVDFECRRSFRKPQIGECKSALFAQF